MRTTLAACCFAIIIGIAGSVAMRAVEPDGSSVRKPAGASHSRTRSAVGHDPRSVSVYVYNKEGELVGPVDAPKLVLSPSQWRQRLTAEQYKVLRAKDTEIPFCGNLVDNKKKGVYSCAACGLPLFSSEAKFDSGTGWPSFFQPVAAENVETQADFSLGIPRSEVKCVRCKSHMGHVFDDGPHPTRLRFCLNSASLKFTSADDLASLADPVADRVQAAPSTAENGTSGNRSAAAAKVRAAEGTKEVQDRNVAPAAAGRRGLDKSATNDRGATSGGGDGSAAAPHNQETQAKENDVTETSQTATAIFAGGCFWCTEAAFAQLKGVSDVESGYAGGRAATATYEQVSLGHTGHAEAIRVTYDPAKISYEQLLMVFFDAHDPTQLNRQGADIGSQYRSAIFFADAQQKKAAESKIHELSEHKAYGPRRIVTKLEPLVEFFPAEAYHQDYVLNNPLQPYVQGHSIPKACTIQKRHPELIDPAKAVRSLGY